MASFLSMLSAQEILQRDTYGFNFTFHDYVDGEIVIPPMTDEHRMAFIREQSLALIKELGEALDETGWKPWASSRHLNVEPYVGEVVDVFHFMLNLLLVTGVSPAIMAEKFSEKFFAKQVLNAQRQHDGYDGVTTKCPECRRALDEINLHELANGSTVCVCGHVISVTAHAPAHAAS